jgi:hypothetical protein
MAVGSLDATQRIPKRLAALGVSLNFYGRCVGLSSGEVSNLFSAKKPLSGSKAKSLLAMVADLEMLAQAFSPCPVLFKDYELILGLVKQLKDGSLLVGKMRDGVPEIYPQNFDWGF